MCGRYSILRSRQEHEQFFKARAAESLQFGQQYNAAPSQQLPVILAVNGERTLVFMQWGYLMTSAKSMTSKPRINTRMETLIGSTEGDTITGSRCIVPASGFYEWEKRGGEKIPYYFQAPQQTFLCFAGAWQTIRQGSTGTIKAFTILTKPADENVAAIHNRMPLLLDKEGVHTWLHESSLSITLLNQLQNKHIALNSYPVGKAVNSPYNNSPACIREEQPKQPCLL